MIYSTRNQSIQFNSIHDCWYLKCCSSPRGCIIGSCFVSTLISTCATFFFKFHLCYHFDSSFVFVGCLGGIEVRNFCGESDLPKQRHKRVSIVLSHEVLQGLSLSFLVCTGWCICSWSLSDGQLSFGWNDDDHVTVFKSSATTKFKLNDSRNQECAKPWPVNWIKFNQNYREAWDRVVNSDT